MRIVHTNNSRAPPTISWKVTHVIGEIKFFVQVQPLATVLVGENFVVYDSCMTMCVRIMIFVSIVYIEYVCCIVGKFWRGSICG